MVRSQLNRWTLGTSVGAALLALPVCAPVCLAQVDGAHTDLSVSGGPLHLDDGLDVDPSMGLFVQGGFFPGGIWGGELNALLMSSVRESTGEGDLTYGYLGGQGILSLVPLSRVEPYLAAGLGISRVSFDGDASYSMTAPVGAGVRVHVAPHAALRFDVRSIFAGFDDGNTVSWTATAGVSFSLGRDTDRDGDGVTDGRDSCPETPIGAEVDWRGCPYDDDADGVPRGLDECPDTPANAVVDDAGCAIYRRMIRRGGG